MFRPVSPRRLGVARALFYIWYAVQLLHYQPLAWMRLPNVLWEPVLLFKLLGAPNPGFQFLTAIGLSIFVLASSLGLFTRVSTVGVALLGTWSFGLTTNYGVADFHHYPLILISWVLAWSDCGKAFSLDRRLDKTQGYEKSGDFRWPLRLSHLCLLLPMASAGTHKALGTWLTQPAATIEYFIRFKHVLHARVKHQAPLEITLWPLEHPTLMAFTAYAIVILELGCPLALFDRPRFLRLFWVGGLFFMQLSLATTFFTLGSFPWLGAYFFWVPWERLWPEETEPH